MTLGWNANDLQGSQEPDPIPYDSCMAHKNMHKYRQNKIVVPDSLKGLGLTGQPKRRSSTKPPKGISVGELRIGSLKRSPRAKDNSFSLTLKDSSRKSKRSLRGGGGTARDLTDMLTNSRQSILNSSRSGKEVPQLFDRPEDKIVQLDPSIFKKKQIIYTDGLTQDDLNTLRVQVEKRREAELVIQAKREAEREKVAKL